MILLDANYFLRWFLNDVPAQNKEVVSLLARSKAESLKLDRITIAEVTYVLRGMGYDHKQIALVIKEFSYNTSVKAFDKITSNALEIYSYTTLDFDDCWLASKAMSNGFNIATFDRQLLKFITSKD